MGFNHGLPANASAIWDGRAMTGHFYRVFCAHQEHPEGNLGYVLGLARSADLVDWELAPGLMG